MRIIIMGAGDAKRWGNYMGVPKQLVDVFGERLLDRTIRQFSKHGEVFVTVPERGFFGDINATEILGKNESELDKFINTEELIDGRVVLLWGDTYFSDEAVEYIMSVDSDFAFFGRKTSSDVTYKPYQELFALKTDKRIIDGAKELDKNKDSMERCASWELYRFMHGYPLDENIIDENFYVIDDETEDFDYPKDYEVWLERIKKRRQE